MAIREYTFTSLGELLDAVTPPRPDPDSGHRRDRGVYHGASDARFPLLTSLDRLGGTDPPHTKVDLEAHILRNFARHAYPHLPSEPASDWELLVIAQHHGVPTRLLDWSHSPLVAAHFATCNAAPGTDCAIWRLDWPRLHEAFGFKDLALLIEDLRELEVARTREPFTPWALFDGETDCFACMIEPPALDARIVAQTAAFTLCSDACQSFDAFLAANGLGEALTRYVIPAEAVPAVRDQLDLAGIEERRLFPGLDGVAASICRYYG